MLGSVLTALFVASALLSLVWTPWPATEIDIPNKLAPPSAAHWLGTDSLGRDIVSQLLVGARTSILVGVVAVLIGLVLGVALGALASARRGWVEEGVMRLSDFTFAFPALLSAIMLGAIYGPGLMTGIVAIGVFNIPVFARTTRAAANAVWAREYVLAARAAGLGPWRISVDHVLPNIASVLIVQATVQFATAIIAEAALQLPGPGHAAADAQLGPHAQRGADADVPGAAAGHLPRRGHRAGRAGPEPDGRRPARPARSEAGAQALNRGPDPQAMAAWRDDAQPSGEGKAAPTPGCQSCGADGHLVAPSCACARIRPR